MGQLVRTMLESGVKLGVIRKRGSGEVNDNIEKYPFERHSRRSCTTQVHQMSIPTAIYEGLLNMKHGHKVLGMAAEAKGDAPCAEIFKR